MDNHCFHGTARGMPPVTQGGMRRDVPISRREYEQNKN